MIGLGGAVGAYARYRFSRWIFDRTGRAFPWGTLAVNVLGAFALGLILPFFAEPAAGPVAALLTVGLAGSFTTFSTFALDAVLLLKGRGWGPAGSYAGASVGLGLLALYLGLQAGGMLR